MKNLFNRFATTISCWAGHPATFLCALLVIVLWGASGPVFGFSDTWQLIINTGTTIITFLMVFLIQHTQNRDTGALHLKLDELIRAHQGARNMLIDLEEATDEEIEEIKTELHKARRAVAAERQKKESARREAADERSKKDGARRQAATQNRRPEGR
jgi:low affinity Fe/Cu permease